MDAAQRESGNADTTAPVISAEDAELAFLRPLRTAEWLALPVVLAVLGAGATTALVVLGAEHGKWYTPLGWCALAVTLSVIALGGVFAVSGWRSFDRSEVAAARTNVRVHLIGFAAVGLAISIVGEGSGAVPLMIGGVLVLAGILFRYRTYGAQVELAVEFRRSVIRLVWQCYLFSGIVLAVASASFVIAGLVVESLPSHLASAYVGGGFVDFLVGIVGIGIARGLRGRSLK
jgi:hypothetical protein